jgi:hypothetical protein
MDDRVFTAVNVFARATPWLHGVLVGYATYGVVLFAVLLGWGWWTARERGSGMPAALWAPLGMLLAVAVNQPIVAAGLHRRALPQDVLAGFAVGVVVTLIRYVLVRRLLTVLVLRLEQTRARALLTPLPAPAYPQTVHWQ